MTMTLISTITVGVGGVSTIDFTSIPQTYTDLLILFSPRIVATGNIVNSLQLNNDGGSNYIAAYLQGTGGAASSSSATGVELQIGYVNDAGTTANTFSNQSIYIPNYRSSVIKSLSIDTVQENAANQGLCWINSGRWNGTAAITSIALKVFTGGTYVQNTTASLYGISTTGATGATVA